MSLVKDEHYIELGKISFRYIDRLGDPHPGIDSAEDICDELYNEMIQYLRKTAFSCFYEIQRKDWEDPLDRA